MTTPDQHAQVAGSWMATAAGWLVSLWQWFSGDASGMTVLVGIGTLLLTAIKVSQEVQAWRARDEQQQALRKLWDKMSARSRTRPASFDSRQDPP